MLSDFHDGPRTARLAPGTTVQSKARPDAARRTDAGRFTAHEFGQSSCVDALRDATYFVAAFNASLKGPPPWFQWPSMPS